MSRNLVYDTCTPLANAKARLWVYPITACKFFLRMAVVALKRVNNPARRLDRNVIGRPTLLPCLYTAIRPAERLYPIGFPSGMSGGLRSRD